MPPGTNIEFNERVIPCSQLFRTKGELAEWWTAAWLVDNLKSKQVGDYRILVNYNLPRDYQGATSFEFDLILINRYGIFPIEVKHWNGTVTAFDSYWMQKDRKCEDVFALNSHKSKTLHSRLFGRQSKLSHLGNVSVSGLIVLFNGTERFRNMSQQWNGKNVFGLTFELKNAVSSTENLHNGTRSQTLSNEDIRTVCNELNRIYEPGEKIIGHYRLIKEAAAGDLFEAFQAEDLNLHNRHVRVKRYELQLMSAKQERAILTFQNSARVLALLEAHPNIVQTFDYFPDPNRANLFYEITEWVNGKRLDEAMRDLNRRITYSEQKSTLKAICAALSHAHTEQIYHRNIKPETVFINDKSTVKLGDFDFAKVVGDITIHATLGIIPSNWRTAPELIVNPSNASPRSDIYSLGALWYEMAIFPTLTTRIDPELVAQFEMPEDAKILLKGMVERSPYNRPANIEDIWRQIDKISYSQ